MQYRHLGNSGLNVSVIGLGCEGFVGKDQAFTDRLIGRAMAAGGIAWISTHPTRSFAQGLAVRFPAGGKR